MQINHRQVSFPEGVTVHRAAELNGVYIPSLCSHKDLSPFGGCRVCMVEIEGMRGYPLSCNTKAAEGMKVLTDTATLKELRAEILKLILSEHPSSCLVCGEKAECRDYQGTIRKTGVTTGCRFCPNDGQCELQDLVERIGVTEIDYPIYYHGYEPEHDDPFYDRDYNICILCGRCVRMCQEVRGSGVLAFTYRGPRAKIGPAFGRSHVEAGCEFCGACVDVCPTGALADKASKWDGKPDGSKVSTCPFCAVGCQLELDHKDGRLSKASAHLDPEVNDGQLCVKGRFCLPEVTHHFERAKWTMLQKGNYFRKVTWEEALQKVAAELKGIRPDEFLMLVSPDLTNESLFAAQKFVRQCLGSNGIDSTARLELAGGPDLWSKLFSLPISIKGIAQSDVILAVGLDSRFNFSVVGTKVRKALDRGAKLVTIDARDSNLARYTDHWLRPTPGTEALLLGFLAKALSNGGLGHDPNSQEELGHVPRQAGVEPKALTRALQILTAARDLTVIVGPQVFHYANSDRLAQGLAALAEHPSTNFIPLYFGANSRGALEMGLLPEPQNPRTPEPFPRVLGLADVLGGSKRPKVLYLVGEVPFTERPDCDFLIVQDTFLPPFKVDAFLPAASFAEAGGTLINMEGRVQEIVPIESPPEGVVAGFTRPDWRIFSDLAKTLQCSGMDYRTREDVVEDIRRAVPDFPSQPDRLPRRMKPIERDRGIRGQRDRVSECPNPPLDPSIPVSLDSFRFLLVAEPAGFRHRGVDIASKVGGLGELALEEGFRMNPEDLASLGLADGDQVTVTIGGGDMTHDGSQLTAFSLRPDSDSERSAVSRWPLALFIAARQSPTASGPAKSNRECPKGVIYYTRPVVFGGLEHRRALWPLYRLEQNPVRANLTRASTSSGLEKRVVAEL